MSHVRRFTAILHDMDDRLLVIIGPCSIHDTKAAMQYAKQLMGLR
jgi:3-deoxy-7-phosphoheptulonate synthase